MENRHTTTVRKSQSTGAKTPLATTHGKKHRNAFAWRFWAAAFVLLLAGTAGVLVMFKPTFSANKSIVPDTTADLHRLGTIVSDNGSVRCVRGTFDNATGSISGSRTSCETSRIGHGGEAPSPLGTIRTLNAISDSFRK